MSLSRNESYRDSCKPGLKVTCGLASLTDVSLSQPLQTDVTDAVLAQRQVLQAHANLAKEKARTDALLQRQVRVIQN